MAPTDFSHLLSSLKALSPEQVCELRQQLDDHLHKPTRRGKTANRSSDAPPNRQPLTRDELNQRLIAAGLIVNLPDPSLDVDDDDPDDEPVIIKGEPLSETIIRERR